MIENGAPDEKYLREFIAGASIRLSDSRVITHDTHYGALCDAFAIAGFPGFTTAEEFYEAAKTNDLLEQFGVECGFVTTNGRFLSREEAHQVALVSGQVGTFERWLDRSPLR